MSVLAAASCCCNNIFDPCNAPSAGSFVRVSIQYRVAVAFRYKLLNCGSCVPCDISACAPVTVTATPAFGVSSFSRSITPGGPACGYNDVDITSLASYEMATPWAADIPWVSSGTATGNIQWHIPTTGAKTGFLAAAKQRVDTYSGQGAGLRITRDISQCCASASVTVDTQCPPIATQAQFRSWWSYTAGPVIFTIRRSSTVSAARRWRVTGGNFEILNASSVVLFSTALAGKTFATLRTALNASSAAVSVQWPTPTPDVASQGLTAEYFKEQLNTGLTNIPTSTQAPSNVLAFTLPSGQADEVPDPPEGECSSAVANIGWSVTAGNVGSIPWTESAYLWSPGVQTYDFGRGSCAKALYLQMCGGVQFEGTEGYYPNGAGMDQVLFCGAFTTTVECPGTRASNGPLSGFTCAGQCCERECEENGCGVESCSGPDCLGAPPTTPFPSGYWRPSVLGTAWEGQYSTSSSAGDYGANFSDCCPEGYECWGYQWARSDAIKGSVWSKVERLA